MTSQDSTPQSAADGQPLAPEAQFQLRFERFSRFVEEFASRISLGGMFFKTREPRPVSTVVSFDIKLADGFRLIQGIGEVVWMRPDGLGSEYPAGMGIRFHSLDDKGRELVLKLLEEHLKTGGEPFDIDDIPPGAIDDVEEAQAAIAAAFPPLPGAGQVADQAGLHFDAPWGEKLPELPLEILDEEPTLVGPRQAEPAAFDEESDRLAPLDFEAPAVDQILDDESGDFLQAGEEEEVEIPGFGTEALPPEDLPEHATGFDLAEEAAEELEQLPDFDLDDEADLDSSDLDFSPDQFADADAELGGDVAAAGSPDPTSGLWSMPVDSEELPTIIGSVAASVPADPGVSSGVLSGTAEGADSGPLHADFSAFETAEVPAEGRSSGVADEPFPAPLFEVQTAPEVDPELPTAKMGKITEGTFEFAALRAPDDPSGGLEPPPETDPPALDSGPMAVADHLVSFEPGSLETRGSDVSPESFSPESFSPESFSPESFSPESFSPESFSPESFSPESFSPESFSPESFSPESFSPESPAAEEATFEAPHPDVPALENQSSLDRLGSSLYPVQDYEDELEGKSGAVSWKSSLARAAKPLAILVVLGALVGAAYLFRNSIAKAVGVGGPEIGSAVGSLGEPVEPGTTDLPPVASEEPDTSDPFPVGADSSAANGRQSENALEPSEELSPESTFLGSVDPSSTGFPAPEVIEVASQQPAVAGTGLEAATAVLDISIRPGREGTVVDILLNGEMARERLAIDDLAYVPDRQQLRISGIGAPYSPTVIEVGGSDLQRIRTGLHEGQEGPELRLVFDFGGEDFYLDEIRSSGDRFEVIVRRR